MLTPLNLAEATEFCINILDEETKGELAGIGFYNPHMKYKTDFERTISEILGLTSTDAHSLLLDIAVNHAEKLHFLEVDGGLATPDAALRVIVNAIATRLSTEIHK